MPQVARFELPDGRIGRFEVPDGTTPEQAQAMIQAELPKLTAAAPADRIPGAAPAKPEKTGDIVSSSAIRGFAGLAGLPVDALNLLRAARNKAQGTTYPGFTGGSQDIIKGVETVTGTPLYKPEGIGKPGGSMEGYVASTLEGMGAGAPFGPVGALIGGIGGAGGEFGERVTGSPWGRLVGSLLTSGAAGLTAGTRRPTGSVLRDVLDDTDPQTLQAAQRLQDDARRMGITLTGPEAIAQVKNSATAPVLGLQRVVEQSRGGGPTMATTLAARPEQNRQAFSTVLNRVGPQVADPTEIAPRVQQAAEETVQQARQAGNARALPFYQQAEGDIVAGANMAALMRDPVARDAINKVLKDPFYGVIGRQPNSVAVLDAAKKYLDDIAASAKQEGMGNKARIASSSVDEILKTADLASPAYPQARAIVQKNIREVVEPMQRQPIGQLAEAKDFAAQRNILFPANPETLTPSAVRQTIGRIRVQDPTAARDLTRQFLETQFNEITQNLVSGGNAMGGAKFAASITGNTKQAENIRAAVESVGGANALKGFNKFLQIMEAQGKRQPAGSMTEFNKQITDELSRGGMIGGAATTAASPGTLLTTAKDWWNRFQYSGNSAELAQIFTDPKSVERMSRLAMLNAGTERAQALAAIIASSNIPQRDSQEQQKQ